MRELHTVSPEAAVLLKTKMKQIQRHVQAKATLRAARVNADVISADHMDAALADVIRERSVWKPVMLASIITAVATSAGKAIVVYLLTYWI